MTDEQRPWQAWPEYDGAFRAIEAWAKSDEAWQTAPQARSGLDALCARVWREAKSGKRSAYNSRRVLNEWQRADAAEAQRDRLAAALREAEYELDFRMGESHEVGCMVNDEGPCFRCRIRAALTGEDANDSRD